SVIPPADRSDRRSVLLDAGGPRPGTQGDHETVGETRRADRTRHGRHDWNVRRSPGYRRQVAAGDRGARVSDAGIGSRPETVNWWIAGGATHRSRRLRV